MIYRQRTTIFDEFLLRVLFPWLVVLRVTPLLGLARFWSVPVYPRKNSRARVGGAGALGRWFQRSRARFTAVDLVQP